MGMAAIQPGKTGTILQGRNTGDLEHFRGVSYANVGDMPPECLRSPKNSPYEDPDKGSLPPLS